MSLFPVSSSPQDFVLYPTLHSAFINRRSEHEVRDVHIIEQPVADDVEGPAAHLSSRERDLSPTLWFYTSASLTDRSQGAVRGSRMLLYLVAYVQSYLSLQHFLISSSAPDDEEAVGLKFRSGSFSTWPVVLSDTLYFPLDAMARAGKEKILDWQPTCLVPWGG